MQHPPTRLRRARLAKGISQLDVCASVGISQPYLSNLERFGYRPRRSVFPERIAAVLGATVDELFPEDAPTT